MEVSYGMHLLVVGNVSYMIFALQLCKRTYKLHNDHTFNMHPLMWQHYIFHTVEMHIYLMMDIFTSMAARTAF